VHDDLAGVVLAAGAGRRLEPISRWAPKALCPVAGVPLVDRALDRIGPHVGGLAVNLHHGAAALEAHLGAGRGDAVHRSLEAPEALGTAGALGALRPWLADRHVLVTNADAWLGRGVESALEAFVATWDRERIRLLCVREPERGDFDDLRYCGVALLPAADVGRLEPVPSGLYEVSWREALAVGRVELVEADVAFVDCGTPADYLRANLLATEGLGWTSPEAEVEPGAQVRRSVVWAGAVVRSHEQLDDAVRSAAGTVLVR
jgi:NDP-sugar pyrophosphorylase family protein